MVKKDQTLCCYHNAVLSRILGQRQQHTHNIFAFLPAVYVCTLSFFFSESDVVNLISVDCPNLQKAFRFLHFPWSCPLQIVVSLYFLYDILDMAVVPGKKSLLQ